MEMKSLKKWLESKKFCINREYIGDYDFQYIQGVFETEGYTAKVYISKDGKKYTVNLSETIGSITKVTKLMSTRTSDIKEIIE